MDEIGFHNCLALTPLISIKKGNSEMHNASSQINDRQKTQAGDERDTD